MKTVMTVVALGLMVLLYTIVGTGTRVDEIKARVPKEVAKRGWKILRYEGYQWGSFSHHGGKCWYHVCNIDNPDIQYRVQVSLWNNELQWYYDAPEKLTRVDVKLNE